MDILSAITEEYKKSDIPAFGVGDTVKVHIKIKEGQQRKSSDLRRLRAQEAERRHRRDLYSKKNRIRRRRRKDIPASFAAG